MNDKTIQLDQRSHGLTTPRQGLPTSNQTPTHPSIGKMGVIQGMRQAMNKALNQRHARHVIVIAGASGCGKTHLIKRMGQPPHDDFVLKLLQQLDCDPNQRFKRSTVERMQRLLDPNNAKKRKTRKLNHCLLIHLDLTSINHRSNLVLLQKITSQTERLDVLTLYTPPREWRERILQRLHTENEPSMRAALIALSAHFSKRFSSFLYHREYNKWFTVIETLKTDHTCMANSFSELVFKNLPQSSIAS